MENLIGKAGIESTKVFEGNTARGVGSGALDVYATPAMIALMEAAACKALAEVLKEGQTTVGSKIDVEHVAPSPIGAQVQATAMVKEVDGRKIVFNVHAQDDKNGNIGFGTHTRVIVDSNRFLEKASGMPIGKQ
jgi:predicted thioesterase